MDEGDPVAELLVVLHERGLRDAERRLFLHRLDEERELEPARPRDALAARDDDEVRGVNAVIAEDLFRDALVLAKDQPGRAATGKGDALHLEQGHDVLVEAAVVFKLIGKVKKDVGGEALQFLAEKVQVIEDGEMLRRVTEHPERLEHVRLGFPIGRRQLRRQILVDRGRSDGVEKSEDFEFFLHVTWCV